MDGKWEGKEDPKTAVLPRKFYQCNRRQCGARCSWPTCRHTADRAYAVCPDAPEEDFETMGGYLWQKIEEEA